VNWNPLKTLTGRLVLVTIVAVAVSYALALVLFSNERGAALRRAAETAVIERVAYTVQQLRDTPASHRAELAHSIRDFGIRYSIDRQPDASAPALASDAQRIAAALAERLNGMDVRAAVRTVQTPVHRWRTPPDRAPPPDDDDQIVHPPPSAGATFETTEVTFSAPFGDGTWLNARARLPGPRPAPLSVLISALVAVVAVGAGAALISRQIGRPLADLATAARALGSGQANVAAPVSGPDDVRRASTAFNAMAERLGRQMSRQRQMLWALSHDLRTPITALRLRAELVEDEATRQRLLGPIAEMEMLTEQALALARAGASEEARSNVDLAEIVRTLCGELEDMGINARAEAPNAVMADCRPSEIARAVRNLAENAAKYGGGGVVRVFRNGVGEAVIEVIDDGPGVAAEQLAQIASPFFRADSSRSEANGAGLGLAIVQAIADGHGGRLALANRTPRGFSATLTLPA
jgi:signal transduction histidine kinase